MNKKKYVTRCNIDLIKNYKDWNTGLKDMSIAWHLETRKSNRVLKWIAVIMTVPVWYFHFGAKYLQWLEWAIALMTRCALANILHRETLSLNCHFNEWTSRCRTRSLLSEHELFSSSAFTARVRLSLRLLFCFKGARFALAHWFGHSLQTDPRVSRPSRSSVWT